MTLHTDVFIEGHLLAAADVAEDLYLVPAGGRCRVHEFVVSNIHDDAVTFLVWLEHPAGDARYFGGTMLAGETWFRPLGTWKESRLIRGTADVGGVIEVYASGSLLSL